MWRWALPSLGTRGERLAARFLRRAGYRILARSYRSPLGEIDLIAGRHDLIVFVEVKTRTSADHGEPWRKVDQRKRRQITKSAVYFLKAHPQLSRAVRFDIVAVTWPPGWFVKPHIEHFESAFDTEGPWSI